MWGNLKANCNEAETYFGLFFSFSGFDDGLWVSWFWVFFWFGEGVVFCGFVLEVGWVRFFSKTCISLLKCYKVSML